MDLPGASRSLSLNMTSRPAPKSRVYSVLDMNKASWTLLAPVFALAIALQAWQPAPSETWTFDKLESIGGRPTTIVGHPRVIDTPQGKAVQFNGVDDALFIDVHPLAGAETFTWEVVFRPDTGGSPAQRFAPSDSPAVT